MIEPQNVAAYLAAVKTFEKRLPDDPDFVQDAALLVWERLSAGEEVKNLPALLRSTAYQVRRATRRDLAREIDAMNQYAAHVLTREPGRNEATAQETAVLARELAMLPDVKVAAFGSAHSVPVLRARRRVSRMLEAA